MLHVCRVSEFLSEVLTISDIKNQQNRKFLELGAA